MAQVTAPTACSFQLRFVDLPNPGRALCFPCDSRGTVDLDCLTERAKSNYLCARALIGRDYAYPVVDSELH